MKKIILSSMVIVLFLWMSSSALAECPSGIVSYLQFNEGSGTTAADSYGSNDGTINGATWTTGIVGNALSFDGVDDYVNIPYDPSFNLSSFTFQAWVKFPQTYSGGQIIGRAYDYTPGYGESLAYMGTQDGKIYVAAQGEGSSPVSLSTTNLNLADDQWHLATFVRDVQVDEIKIYVDGAHYISYGNSAPGDMTHNYQDFIIGSNNGAAPFYSGLIDEVAIYNRVLSSTEISDNYNNGIAGNGYCEAVAVCGNGIVEGAEECDDGNIENGDGCNEDCTIGPCVCVEAEDFDNNLETTNQQICVIQNQWTFNDVSIDLCSSGVCSGGQAGCDAALQVTRGHVEADPLDAKIETDIADFSLDLSVNHNLGSDSCTFTLSNVRMNSTIDTQVCGTNSVNMGSVTSSDVTFDYELTGCSLTGEILNTVIGMISSSIEAALEDEIKDTMNLIFTVQEPLCDCGNRLVENAEECDDGNKIDGDGCSSTCEIEIICGDGILAPGEDCDDGNNIGGDGCNEDCTIGPCFCSSKDEFTQSVVNMNLDACVASQDYAFGYVTAELCGSSVCSDGMTDGCNLDPQITSTRVTKEESGVAIGLDIEDMSLDLGVEVLNIPDTCTIELSNIQLNGSLDTLMCGDNSVSMPAVASTDISFDLDVVGCSQLTNSLIEILLDIVSPTLTNSLESQMQEEIYSALLEGQSAALCDCGNGVIEVGEECDDSNLIDGDGCSSTCTLECIPSPEICDSLDNDCDGQVDEDNVCFGCGSTITENTILEESYNCAEEGFIIGADDITFDCNGHTILGSGAPIGIIAKQRDNITIQNCIVYGFAIGIMFNSTDNSQLINNDLSGNVMGVYIGSEGNLVQGNQFDGNNVGLVIAPNSSNNSVVQNTVVDNIFGLMVETANEEMIEVLIQPPLEDPNATGYSLELMNEIGETMGDMMEELYGLFRESIESNSTQPDERNWLRDNFVNNNSMGIEVGYINNVVEDNELMENVIGIASSGAFTKVEGNNVSGSEKGVVVPPTSSVINNTVSECDVAIYETSGELDEALYEVNNQKAQQYLNMLSSVMKSIKEMQTGIVRNIIEDAPPDEGINNNTVENNSKGVIVGDNSDVSNNRIKDNDFGIIIEGDNNSVRGNSITNNGLAVMTVNFNISNASTINLFESKNNVMTNNLMDNNGFGFMLFKPENSQVAYNLVSNNDGVGIFLSPAAYNNTVDSNTVDNNEIGIAQESISEEIIDKMVEQGSDSADAYRGLFQALMQKMQEAQEAETAATCALMEGCGGNTVSNNNVSNNDVGIEDGGTNNDLIYNTVINNGVAILVGGQSNNIGENTISNNDVGVSISPGHAYTVLGQTNVSVVLRNPWGNSVENNVVDNNTVGFSLVNSSNNTITGNIAIDNGIGINLDGSVNTLSSNLVDNNHIGILIAEGNNTVDSNTVSNNTLVGVGVSSSGNTVTDNLAGFNSLGFSDKSIEMLVLWVMYEAAQSSDEMLQELLDKLQAMNEIKAEQREYLNEMRGMKNNYSNNLALDNGVGFDIGGSLNDFNNNIVNNNDVGFILSPYNLSNGTTVLPTNNNLESNVLDNNDFGIMGIRVKDSTFSSNTINESIGGLYISPVSENNTVTDNSLLNTLNGYMMESTQDDVMETLLAVFVESIRTTDSDKEYWLNKMADANEIADALGDYLQWLNDAFSNESGNTADGEEFSYFADSDIDSIYDYAWGVLDNCQIKFNPDKLDSDGDGTGDVCDPCPQDPNDKCDPSQSTGESIGAEGGTLTLGTAVKADFLAGALDYHVSISVSGGNGTNVTDVPTFEDTTGLTGGSVVYTFGPEGTTFSVPVTLTLEYDDTGIAEDTVDIYHYEPVTQTFESQGATLDTVANTATLALSQFSTFIVGAYADLDGDGYGIDVDCDDNNAEINPGAKEICDGIDNDCDGTVDNADEDNDGLIDCFGDDKCLGTTAWSVTQELKPNHYDSSNIVLADTYGCSCEQILFCKPGGNNGEYKFGCSQGTMDIWLTQDSESWAPDCQVDGIATMEGVSKPFFENTDDDWLPDIIDGDNDNDGVPDNQDDMIEDQDLPGDPDYGIPDWHPKSKHKK